jgi:hypothetical protein
VRASPLWLSALALGLAGCGGGGDDGQPARTAPLTAAEQPPTRTQPTPKPTVAPPRRGETYGAKVTKTIALRARPRAGARRLTFHGKRTEFGSERILAVVKVRGRWLGVKSEKLRNDQIAWIRADRVELLRELWSIEVDLSERAAVLRKRGKRVAAFRVAVGAPGTDTPTGVYGVTDRLTTGGAGSGYGCCVLALTGRQRNIPQDWPGGDRLAIHGTSAPWSIGTAASHGCLRASEETMQMLMRRVPLGAQVRIHA